MANSEIQKQAYPVAMSFGEPAVSQSGNDGARYGSTVAPAPQTSVIFKYIVVRAYQADLKTVGLLFCLHSFLS